MHLFNKSGRAARDARQPGVSPAAGARPASL